MNVSENILFWLIYSASCITYAALWFASEKFGKSRIRDWFPLVCFKGALVASWLFGTIFVFQDFLWLQQTGYSFDKTPLSPLAAGVIFSPPGAFVGIIAHLVRQKAGSGRTKEIRTRIEMIIRCALLVMLLFWLAIVSLGVYGCRNLGAFSI
jgi:hypothetical protein